MSPTRLLPFIFIQSTIDLQTVAGCTSRISPLEFRAELISTGMTPDRHQAVIDPTRETASLSESSQMRIPRSKPAKLTLETPESEKSWTIRRPSSLTARSKASLSAEDSSLRTLSALVEVPPAASTIRAQRSDEPRTSNMGSCNRAPLTSRMNDCQKSKSSSRR